MGVFGGETTSVDSLPVAKITSIFLPPCNSLRRASTKAGDADASWDGTFSFSPKGNFDLDLGVKNSKAVTVFFRIGLSAELDVWEGGDLGGSDNAGD